MKFYRALPACLVLALGAPSVQAQHTFTFSFESNLTASADTNPSAGGSLTSFFQESSRFRSTYGAYPTLRMTAVGRSSALRAFFGYGYNRVYNTELDLNSNSITAGLDWQYTLSRNWSLSFSDDFKRSPDFSTLDLFRGILFTPEGIFLDYDTVTLRRNSYANEANLDLEYSLAPRSKLSFGATHSLRNYAENPLFTKRLSDQTRASAYLRYSRELSPRSGWDVEYRMSYFEFRDFESARTHDPAVGFYHRFSPDLILRVRAGPSYTESQGTPDSYLGYQGSVTVAKSFRENEFTLSLTRRNGTSTGLGSISDVIRVGLGWTRPLGDRIKLSLAASYYDTTRRFDNPVTTRGPQGSLKFSFLLNENLSLEVGGQYQDQSGTDVFDIQRKRAFVTLRFAWPDFWRFRR